MADPLKLRKHESKRSIDREGKVRVEMRRHYRRDKELDKLLNHLEKDELLKLFYEYKKLIEYSKKLKSDQLDPEDFPRQFKKFTKKIQILSTPMICKLYRISEESLVFTDDRFLHIGFLVKLGIQNQITRRGYREVFGDRAEKLFPEIFEDEVVKPKNYLKSFKNHLL